jgi:hypothetical protein
MEIKRLETVNNRENNPEVFCEVIFTSETYGKFNYGHWLTPGEYATYVADNDSINTIMAGYQVTAELLKAQEMAG